MRILGNTLLAFVIVVGIVGCDSGSSSSSDNTPLPGTGGMGAGLDGEGGAAGADSTGENQGGMDDMNAAAGTPGTGGTPNGMIDGVSCDRSGFNASEQIAATTEYGIAYQALAPTGTAGRSDVMLTQIYTSFDGPTEPGVYSLDGINFRDCGLCLLMQTNCSENAPCEKTFYADEGSVEIITLDDGQFAARYDNVVYKEVTISQGDSTSTPVAGGESWCMNGYSFDQPLQAGGGGGGQDTEQICAGPVACMGEEVANFSVKSCETNENVNVRTYFEGADAALFLGTAGWCPACSQRVPQVVSYAEQTPGLKVMYVLGEDRGYNQPTQSYCQNYARSHNVPISQIFIDHDGEYGHANFFTNIWPYPVDNMIGLPYHAVMNPQDWTYVYGDGGPSGDLNSALSELLQ